MPAAPKTKPKPIALVCSDMHLWHKAPAYRSNEPDWFEAMARSLDILGEYQRELQVPVIIAGDIFDRWNAPPELINFALDNLPVGSYLIPGQHDLPNHADDQSHRSAYGTLTRTLHRELRDGVPINLGDMTLCGFGWGASLDRPDLSNLPHPRIAVVHKYCWYGKSTHPNADPQEHAGEISRWLSRFDAVVIGDNHHPFTLKTRTTRVINCGSFMIRHKSDHAARAGMFYILHDDTSVHPVSTWDGRVDVHRDVDDEEVPEEVDHNLEAIAASLESLSQDDDLDGLLKQLLRKIKVSPEVKELIRATFIE